MAAIANLELSTHTYTHTQRVCSIDRPSPRAHDGERSSQPRRGGGGDRGVCGCRGGGGGRRGRGGGVVRRRGERAGAVRAVPAGRRGAAGRSVLRRREGAARDGGHGGGAARAVQVPGAVRAVVRRAPRPRAAPPGALQARTRHPRRRRHRLQQSYSYIHNIH
uniref:Uncharacterized protein n=1 Tax=Oryza nivara TaxID=4536 RepID=A0A0E0GVD6_ORYNI